MAVDALRKLELDAEESLKLLPCGVYNLFPARVGVMSEVERSLKEAQQGGVRSATHDP